MNGLSIDVLKSITRIRTTFIEPKLGNSISGTGTGFWIQTLDSPVFVTNRHNIDISLKGPKWCEYTLQNIELELRPRVESKNNTPEFVNVSNLECLQQHADADVSVLVNPSIDWSKYNKYTLALEWLAEDSFIKQYVGVGADLAFLGYPQNFFDMQRILPIARHAIIASAPWDMFSHNAISTSDAILASGLSFGGGSGSPVFVSSRGIQINTNNGVAQSADYCPQKIVGVMTGHLETINSSENYLKDSLTDLACHPGSELENHSGLSYFTRSTSILELLN